VTIATKKPSSRWQNCCQLIVLDVAISRQAFRCSICYRTMCNTYMSIHNTAHRQQARRQLELTHSIQLCMASAHWATLKIAFLPYSRAVTSTFALLTSKPNQFISDENTSIHTIDITETTSQINARTDDMKTQCLQQCLTVAEAKTRASDSWRQKEHTCTSNLGRFGGVSYHEISRHTTLCVIWGHIWVEPLHRKWLNTSSTVNFWV